MCYFFVCKEANGCQVYLSRTKHGRIVVLCSAIVEWDTVGIDIIRHHLHTAKWGLFVLCIEQNNSNHRNKNRKVLCSVGLFEDLAQLKNFSRSRELFSLPRFVLFLKWKYLRLNVFCRQ